MTISHLRFLAALLAVVCIAVPASAQDDADLAHLKLAARAQIEKELHGLSSLGPRDLDDVIHFTLHNGKFFPTTRLPLHGLDAQRLTINGLAGQARINVLTMQSLPPPNDYVQFFYRDLSDPRTVATYTEVFSNADSIMVTQAADLPDDGVWSVQLIQSAAPAPQALCLYIQFTAAAGPQIRRRETALNLADLAIHQAADVDRYVRPIFRLLRQEQTVFEVDPHAAYQVLSNLCRPDPAVTSAADAAIADLGADSFADRESASAKLRNLGQAAALYLMRPSTRPLTAEQSMRIDLFLGPYRPLPDEQAQRLQSDPDFLLDCCFNPDPEIRRLAVQQLAGLANRPITLPADLSGPALADAITRLREKLAPVSTPTSNPAPQ